MDGMDDYIWQRRIHHGVRYQKSTVPFPESVGIGLEFNAALDRKEKLDQRLLTNAVMLELCDFAKTVTKSETYFLFEMLEYNFDLGVDMDNDLQCYEYAKRVHNKIKLLKDQIKLKPHRWKETFPLPDHSAMLGLVGSDRPGRYYPKRNKSVDSSVLTDGSKSSQSSESQKVESNGASGSSCFTKKQRGSRLRSDAYPFCKELGVTPTVRPDGTPRPKLDPSLVTNGVMMELLHFSRVLCGKHTSIVHDLVKQNFGLELDKLQFRLHMSKLMEQKYGCLTAEDRDAFRKEPFRVQTRKQQQSRKKRRKCDVYDQEGERLTVGGKRRSDRGGDVEEVWPDGEQSYMCPVDFEADVQSGTDGKPEETTLESRLSAKTKSAASLGVKQEDGDVFVSAVQPQTNGHGAALWRLQPRKSVLKAVSDLFSEDKSENVNVQTLKQRLWVRRSTRSKQILKSSRVNDKFAHCREVGLDFNVGSGSKQNVDLQLLTNFVLWEVYKFSNSMSRSSSSFLLEILDNNFNLNLQDELHQRNFVVYILTKEKILQNHPDRQNTEFLHRRFGFPEIYNTVDVSSEFQPGQDAETEQQTDWDSPASTTGLQPDAEPHPFCKELGLNLWSAERRPVSQKLDLTVLTKGAVLEIVSFVRRLCGAVRETVNDILEHNFDVNLQGGQTEAAEVIQRWYAAQKSLMKRQSPSLKINRWLNMVVPLTGHSQPQAAELRDTGQEPGREPERQVGALNGNVRQVNNYHTCKEIGLDLDVCSKSDAKAKLDLRVLTRGVLCEMHRYVEQNCTQYVPALYEILEYNFDLSSQNHRKVEFAWSIASQVIAMAGKTHRKGDYLNKVFELPFEVSESSQIVCKEEPEDFSEMDSNGNSDVLFVRELKPIDIEVEVE